MNTSKSLEETLHRHRAEVADVIEQTYKHDRRPTTEELIAIDNRALAAIVEAVEGLLGENEQVPDDIWADPRPEKVRARNELRAELRQAIKEWQ